MFESYSDIGLNTVYLGDEVHVFDPSKEEWTKETYKVVEIRRRMSMFIYLESYPQCIVDYLGDDIRMGLHSSLTILKGDTMGPNERRVKLGPMVYSY